MWRLPVDVRRGDRRYPLTLDWLIALTRFADVACPGCGADERLVATKTGLGCAGCVPRRTVQLAPEPTRPPAKPAAKAKQVVTPPPTPRQHPSPVRTDPGRTPATLEKLGDKLTRKVWDAVVCNDRRLARLCALDSPAAAAIRLYGPSGAAWAVGISPTERLAAVAGATTASSGLRQTSNGYVETAAGHRFPFLLRWQASGRTGLIDEILPYDFPLEPAHLSQWVAGPGRTGVHAPPQPRFPLGPVGELLWRRVIPIFRPARRSALPRRAVAAARRGRRRRFARPRGGRGRNRADGLPTSEPDNRPLRRHRCGLPRQGSRGARRRRRAAEVPPTRPEAVVVVPGRAAVKGRPAMAAGCELHRQTLPASGTPPVDDQRAVRSRLQVGRAGVPCPDNVRTLGILNL